MDERTRPGSRIAKLSSHMHIFSYIVAKNLPQVFQKLICSRAVKPKSILSLAIGVALLGIVGLVLMAPSRKSYNLHASFVEKLSEEDTGETHQTEYAVNAPKGQWFDTGIWVGPSGDVSFNSCAFQEEIPQPYEISINGQVFKAALNLNGTFVYELFLWGKDTPLGNHQSSVISNVALDHADKIYLRAADDSSTDHTGVSVLVTR
jgi:hypothetical protein